MFSSKREKALERKNNELRGEVSYLEDKVLRLDTDYRNSLKERDATIEIMGVEREQSDKTLQAKFAATVDNAIADAKKHYDKSMKEAEKLLEEAKHMQALSEMETAAERATMLRDAEAQAGAIVAKALAEAQAHIVASQEKINSMYETAMQMILRVAEQSGTGYPAIVAGMSNGSSASTAEFIKNLTAIQKAVPTPAPVTINTSK